MLKKIRNITIALLILTILSFVLLFVVSVKYVIKGFSLSYPLYGIVFLIAILLIIGIVNKFKTQKKHMMLLISLIAIVACFGCLVMTGMTRVFYGSKKIYKVSIDNYNSDNVILYEYEHFMSLEGMLCVKVNDFIYLRVNETKYCVEYGHSLSNPDNIFLSYNEKTDVLTMKYKLSEDDLQISNTVSNFSDYK